MKRWLTPILFGVLAVMLAACGGAPKAQPAPTYTPYPTYTPFPEQKPVITDIDDLYCDFGFCIGHPTGAYLTDVDAPDEWSEYESGVLIGVNTTGSWMGMDWEKVGKSEWQLEEQALDVANNLGEAQGDARIETVGNFDVALVSSFDSEDEDLPYGSNAAWHCGDRGFRASVFAKSESLPEVLLLEAIARFTCGKD